MNKIDSTQFVKKKEQEEEISNFSLLSEFIDDDSIEKIENRGLTILKEYRNSLVQSFLISHKNGEKKIESIKINIAFSAHIDAGKTTLVEKILLASKVISKAGEVHDGNTQMDSLKQERERGVTIVAGMTNAFWRHVRLNIIDTPGHADFGAEVERSLRVIDLVVVLLDVSEGPQSQTEAIWRQISKKECNITRILFFNKMDGPNPDFFGCLESVRKKFSCNPVPLQIPIFIKESDGITNKFAGVVDLISKKGWIYQSSKVFKDKEYSYEVIDDLKRFSEELWEKTERNRNKLISEIVNSMMEIDENDEIVFKVINAESTHSSEGDSSNSEPWLEEGFFSDDELRRAVKKLTIMDKIFPVFCGSAYKNIGINLLLDAIIHYSPSSFEIKSAEAKRKSDKEIVKISPFSSNFSALSFKTTFDKYGKITFIRVYSGELIPNKTYYNVSKDEKFTVGRIVTIHAGSISGTIEKATSGDVIGVVNVRGSNHSTGDTLCDEENKDLLLDSINFSPPIISLAVIPKGKSEINKVTNALRSMADQDPTFKYEVDDETGQLIMKGVGELHLNVIRQRISTEFGVDFEVGRPKIALYESIVSMKSEEGVEDDSILLYHTYRKQTGGSGHFAKIVFSVHHNSEKEFEFVDKVTSGEIKGEYLKATEEGFKQEFYKGLKWEDCPTRNIKIIVHGGQQHSVDSSSEAFRLAAAEALREMARNNRFSFMLLEPIVKLEVSVPSEEKFVANVRGECMRRRAVETPDSFDSDNYTSENRELKFLIPLSEIFGFHTTLQSLTKGKGSSHIKFSHYEKVSGEDLENLIKSQGIKTRV